MAEDSVAGFRFPAVCRKKVTAAFDRGLLTSDGGVLLLAQAERAVGIAGRLAGCIADPRDQSRVVHGLTDILRARILAIEELPGLNLLLLACFDKLFSDCGGAPPKAVDNRVVRRLTRYPSCFRNLDRVPTFVITGQARSALVRLRATETMLIANQHDTSTSSQSGKKTR